MNPKVLLSLWMLITLLLPNLTFAQSDPLSEINEEDRETLTQDTGEFMDPEDEYSLYQEDENDSATQDTGEPMDPDIDL